MPSQALLTKGPDVDPGAVLSPNEHLWRTVPAGDHIGGVVGTRLQVGHGPCKAKVAEPDLVVRCQQHIAGLDVPVQNLGPQREENML